MYNTNSRQKFNKQVIHTYTNVHRCSVLDTYIFHTMGSAHSMYMLYSWIDKQLVEESTKEENYVSRSDWVIIFRF